MAARRKADGAAPESTVSPDAVDERASEVVLVRFAYATAKDGEVVQLVKGNKITDRFTEESLEHLRSIGFIGSE